MRVHDDTLQGLQEALAYVKGDTTKGRSVTITIDENEIDTEVIIFHQLGKLSNENKRKVANYANELLQASN